jgi:hypothetical protein
MKRKASMSRWPPLSRLRKFTREEAQAFGRAHEGEFVAIPLDGEFGFLRIARKTRFGLYDFKASAIPPLEEIERHRILCVLGGSPEAMASGRWRIIGQKPLEPELLMPVKYFRHPKGTTYLDIYEEGEFKPYAGEDLTKMECAASWEPRHIEERLRNHFADRPDPATESAKVPRELAERLYREYWARQGKEGS